MRYERKFAIRDRNLEDIRGIVALNSAHFSTAYPPRRVNNIYFDTLDFRNHLDTSEGVGIRAKHRVRWYGELAGVVGSPIYEIKLKRGLVGDKKSYRLAPFTVDKTMKKEALLKNIYDHVDRIHLKEAVRRLTPSLINSYDRMYFVSFNGRYRLTIDHDVVFYRFASFTKQHMSKIRDDRTMVVELKYDTEDDRDAHLITNQFPFRMTRNSKYAEGVYRAYSALY